MEQRLPDGSATSAHEGDPTTTAFEDKEQHPTALQSDFSVTSRLLPASSSYIPPPPYPYHDKVGDTKSRVALPAPFPGWQFMLPTDQGSVSARHSHPVWPNTVPNAVFPFPPSSIQLQQQAASQLTSHDYTGNIKTHVPAVALQSESSPLYTLYQAAMASSTSGSGQSSGQQPLYYHQTAIGSQSASHSENGNVTPETKLVTAATSGVHTEKFQSSMPKLESSISSGKQTPAGEASEGESSQEADSGDETDGESSVLSHSSYGGNTSIDEPKKPKRTRTAYSNYQLDQLELVFTQTQYPDIFLREDLSSRLGIREDRIQVWFQNRRARYRKQERTGSVSFRSKYRQRRLQRALQDNRTPMAMYSGYTPGYAPSSTTAPPMMLPSPQSMPPYMSSFHLPSQMPVIPFTSVTSASSQQPPTLSHLPPASTTPTSSCLPGIHTFRPSFCPPLPGYLARGLPAQNGTMPVYNPASIPPTGQKP